jgi:hypothetical protein
VPSNAAMTGRPRLSIMAEVCGHYSSADEAHYEMSLE